MNATPAAPATPATPTAATRATLALSLLVILTSLAHRPHPALAQSVAGRSKTRVAGTVTVTNKGISTIPSFTLGRPAAIFDMSIGRRRLSFEPQFRYGLDGKPWSFIFWGRYRLLAGEKLQVNIGTHPAVIFKAMPVSVNETPGEVLVARRVVAGELYPSYSLAKNVSVGAYYLYSYSLERDGTKNTHFLALRTNLSTGRLSEQYFVRFAPQLYYLRTDARDGVYLNSALSVGKSGLPFWISAAANKAIQTRIAGDNYIWNVSVSYSIN